MLIDINIWYEKIVSMILESRDDTAFDDQRNSNYPIITTPLVAAQRDYSFPISLELLKIRRVDVSYDGVTYFRGREFDGGVPEFGYGSVTNEDQNFIKQAPMYNFKYNSLFLYPEAQSSDAIGTGATLRVEYERALNLFSQSADYSASTMSTSTSIPGIDLPWHGMIAYGAAYEFANANNLPQLQNIKQDLTDWEARLRQAYGRKDPDSVMYFRPAYDAYGDFGGTGVGGDYYGR